MCSSDLLGECYLNTSNNKSAAAEFQKALKIDPGNSRARDGYMRLVKAIRSTVFVNSAAPLGAGPGHACSAEPAGQSGVGIEGGLAGMEGYQRRQLVWFNHA